MKALVHCLFMTTLWLAGSPALAADQPNIVLVFVDDMGWADLSSFGNRAVETVKMDELASEGLRFENFYVGAPICSPSRVAISTGTYPHRWRITSFLNTRKDNQDRGMDQWLDPGAPMLARLLKGAGYRTGHFGKWHMGGQRDVGDAPLITEYGFDESLTNFEGLGPRLLPLCEAYDGRGPQKYDLNSRNLGRGTITWLDRSRVTEAFVSAALDFIKKTREEGKPFYINLWPDDVHSPFFPPEDRRGDGSKRALYLGVLKTMDEQLGVLFDFIRNDNQLRDNTLVLLCSDNGPEQGAGSAGPFRGGKAMLYEGGVRSPLVVWGPGLVDPARVGAVNKASFIAAVDLPPTLLAIAGVTPPPGTNFDGEVLVSLLLGKTTASREKPLFFRRPPDRDAYGGIRNLPDLAVRSGKWKLLCEYDGSNAELYDLQNDRAEENNLAGDHPGLVRRLTARLIAWHESIPADHGATYSPSR